MRPRVSAFENRTHGAEKIAPGRYSDFFNRIGQLQTRAPQQLASVAVDTVITVNEIFH